MFIAFFAGDNKEHVFKPVNKGILEHSDIEMEEVDSDEWDEDGQNPIDNNDCIFCGNHSRNFIKNLEHMTVTHSFFIPDIEFCSDITGLLRYLGEKVSEGKFFCVCFINTVN